MVESNDRILFDAIFNTFDQVIAMERSRVLANSLDTQHYVCHTTCSDVVQTFLVDVLSDLFDAKLGDHVDGEAVEAKGVEGCSTDVSECDGVVVSKFGSYEFCSLDRCSSQISVEPSSACRRKSIQELL